MKQQRIIETVKGPIFSMTAGQPGRPLVLGIHGMSQRNGWHTWEPLMLPLATAGFYVVTVDMPGWGESPAWQPAILGSPGAAEQAVVQILDGLEADTAVLMGKSWGGGVALEVAVNQPQRVTHLILTAPACRDLTRYAGLNQPVLLAWAEDDPVIPYPTAAKVVAHLPQVKLVTYPTGGHSAAPKNAADFAPQAIQFLQQAL